jgi:nitrogen fixation NifU-like protein
MSDLRELYQTTILDHNKKPKNFRKPENANREANGWNPLCGDKVTIYLTVTDDGVVREVGFQGSGCAISTASASMMTQAVKGKTLDQVLEVFDRFHELVAGPPTVEADPGALGKLTVFSGVREYPMRVKCATLPWHTLRSAMRGDGETAKTE